jgi:hypothetical protein
MNIARYRINLDALLARIIYRWRAQTIGGLVVLVAVGGFGSGLIPPFWNGRAALAIVAAPGATVHIDGRSWPRPVYAGQHSILATLPDRRTAWADIDLRASEVLTLTLPAGLPEPRERSLPAAAPGTHIDQVWWADGAWRVTSVQDALPEPEDRRRTSYEPTPTAQPGQTVAVSAQSVERLATLDAYAGLADQVHRNNRLIEAVYRPNMDRGIGEPALGSIEVRGWGQAVQTIPISAPLTLLRFSPDGAALLTAEQLPGGGEQVYLITPDLRRAPVVAIPGHISRLSWRPDSGGVVIHSVQGARLTLTLARFAPSIVAAVIADLPAASYAASLVPLTWEAADVLWIAPDQDGVATLWRAPLGSLIPERVGLMDARALTRLPDGTLRVVVIRGTTVVIGRYQDDILIGETTVPRVPAAPDLIGVWQGNQLLLQGGGRAWLLDVAEEE